MMLFSKKRCIPLVALILCSVLTFSFPLPAAAAEALGNFTTFKESYKDLSGNYMFDKAEVDVSNVKGSGDATVEGNTIKIHATGYSVTDCGNTTIEASTTKVTLYAAQAISIKCEMSGITSCDLANPTGEQTIDVPAGGTVSFSVESANASQKEGLVTFISVTTSTTKRPADCAAYSNGGETYNYLDEAIEAAKAHATDKEIVVSKDGAVYASSVEDAESLDDYLAVSHYFTIPAGITLLVPYDLNNEVITDTPVTKDGLDNTTYITPYVYRELTLKDKTHITVEGSMSVAAQTAAPGSGYHLPNGGAYGPVGHVVMNEGSSITVTGGLYCYGYITGKGAITAESGAVVYERFEIADFRGGGASAMMNLEKKAFPLSQYYIQNIEVPLTLEFGAEEYAWTAIELRFGVETSKLNMIGDDNTFMFGLMNGSVTKKYDPTTDRQIYDVDGDVTLNSIEVTIDNSMGETKINSANFKLPITNSMTINVNSGTTTVNQALAIFPETRLSIDSGAKVVLNADVHVYDIDQWGGYVYQNGGTAKMRQAKWRPGGIVTRSIANDASVVVDGEVIATAGKLYTTSGGASITSTGGGKITMNSGTDSIAYQGTTQQQQLGGLYYSVDYVEIDIGSAQLLNGDKKTYTETANSATNPNTYVYTNGRWLCATHTWSGDTCAVCGVSAVAQIGTDKYHTLAAAVEEYSGTGYIQMLTGTTEATVGDAENKKTICLDLNGQNVAVDTFNVATLYGMDTANNAYTTSNGKLVGNISSVADYAQYSPSTDIKGKYYVSSNSGNTWTFHRFDLGIDSYTFYRNGDTGSMVFNAVFKGDSTAFSEMTSKDWLKGFYLSTTDKTSGAQWYNGTPADALISIPDGSGYILSGTLGFNKDGNSLTFTDAFSVEAALKIDTNENGDDIMLRGPVYFADGITFNGVVAGNSGGTGNE